MDTEYIEAYILKGCWYSKEANKLLSDIFNNRKHNNKIIMVETDDMKNKCKRENRMNTFPQIFYIYDKQKYKIGGYDDLQFIVQYMNKCKEMNEKIFNEIEEKINIKDYKIFLRLVLYLCNN